MSHKSKDIINFKGTCMTNRYTKIAVILHWLVALGIFCMFALGWFMTDLPKKAPDQTSFDLFDLGMFNWQTAEGHSPNALNLLLVSVYSGLMEITQQSDDAD